MKNPLIGQTIPVTVDGRQVLGTISKAGRTKFPIPPETLVVRYEVNGERDWTFQPESLLRRALELKEAVYA